MIRALGLAVGLLLAVPVVVVSLAYLARRWVTGARAGCEIPLAPIEAARAFLRECAAAILLLVVSPFRRLPSLATAAPGARGIVVLLPDLCQPAAALRLLRRRLRQSGWASVVGTTHATLTRIDAAADDLERRIRHLGTPGVPLVLIGHGTGGLLARFVAHRQAGGGIDQIITLATPYVGTESPIVRLPGLRPLAPGSQLLQRLAERDRDSSDRCNRVAIYSDFDPTLLPVDAAYDPAAFNIQVRGIGHFSMLTSRRVFDLIAENLPTAKSQARSR